MSEKLSFHDWKSQGILLQKTCRNPGECACSRIYGRTYARSIHS